MWTYIAYDENGFLFAEAYDKASLIDKLIDECGNVIINNRKYTVWSDDDYKQFTIKRVFQDWLK